MWSRPQWGPCKLDREHITATRPETLAPWLLPAGQTPGPRRFPRAQAVPRASVLLRQHLSSHATPRPAEDWPLDRAEALSRDGPGPCSTLQPFLTGPAEDETRNHLNGPSRGCELVTGLGHRNPKSQKAGKGPSPLSPSPKRHLWILN